jgi:hypothetical protein
MALPPVKSLTDPILMGSNVVVWQGSIAQAISTACPCLGRPARLILQAKQSWQSGPIMSNTPSTPKNNFVGA